MSFDRKQGYETTRAISGWSSGTARCAATRAAAGRNTRANNVFGDFSRNGKDEGGAGENVVAAKGEGET